MRRAIWLIPAAGEGSFEIELLVVMPDDSTCGVSNKHASKCATSNPLCRVSHTFGCIVIGFLLDQITNVVVAQHVLGRARVTNILKFLHDGDDDGGGGGANHMSIHTKPIHSQVNMTTLVVCVLLYLSCIASSIVDQRFRASWMVFKKPRDIVHLCR
jgi:hypothetical protein